MVYIRVSNLISKGNKDWFEVPKEAQESYINSLRTPRSVIDRGWLQYRCQKIFCNMYKRLLFEVISALYFPFFLIVKFFKKKEFKYSVDAIGEFDCIEEVLPKCINEEYAIDNSLWNSGSFLLSRDVLFCLKLAFKYPLSPYFVLKSTFWIAKYSSFLISYKPRAIIVHREYSFSSSVLTEFCRNSNVKHINVMHGEKLYWIRDSFFEFDLCYVWDNHYVNLLKTLKAEPSQFVIAVPPSLQFEVKQELDASIFSDYKYYLGSFTETELVSIVNSLSFIKNNNKSIKFRPHPRYSNLTLLQKYVSDKEIERPEKVPIMKSVANLTYAIGLESTVMLQAYMVKKMIICDDVTYKHKFDLLKEHNWILSDMGYIYLSDLT